MSWALLGKDQDASLPRKTLVAVVNQLYRDSSYLTTFTYAKKQFLLFCGWHQELHTSDFLKKSCFLLPGLNGTTSRSHLPPPPLFFYYHLLLLPPCTSALLAEEGWGSGREAGKVACWHSFFCSSCIVTACTGLALGRVSHRQENKLPGVCMALRHVKPLSGPVGCGKPLSWVMGMSLAPCSPAPHGSAA